MTSDLLPVPAYGSALDGFHFFYYICNSKIGADKMAHIRREFVEEARSAFQVKDYAAGISSIQQLLAKAHTKSSALNNRIRSIEAHIQNGSQPALIATEAATLLAEVNVLAPDRIAKWKNFGLALFVALFVPTTPIMYYWLKHELSFQKLLLGWSVWTFSLSFSIIQRNTQIAAIICATWCFVALASLTPTPIQQGDQADGVEKMTGDLGLPLLTDMPVTSETPLLFAGLSISMVFMLFVLGRVQRHFTNCEPYFPS